MNIKKKIRKAFTNATPNHFGFVCSETETEKGVMIEMKKSPKFSRLREFASTAASFALIIGVVIGGLSLLNNRPDSGPATIGTEPGSQPGESVAATQPTPSVAPEINIQLPNETPKVVNGVYASCEYYNFTYYYKNSPSKFGNSFSFKLVTKTPLPADAYIVLNNIQSEYSVKITPEENAGTTITPLVFWYMNQPDKDWAEHWKQLRADNANIASELEYWENALGEWKNSNPEPLCYSYNVSVYFHSFACREQIASMELIAGDMSRTITMESVWLDNLSNMKTGCSDLDFDTDWEFPAGEYKSEDALLDKTFTNTIGLHIPCKEDSYTFNCKKFIPKEDVTINNMSVYGDNRRIKVECAEFIIMDADGNITKEVWTAGKELTLHKGDKIAMLLYFKDPYTQLVNYRTDLTSVIEYKCDGEAKQWYSHYSPNRDVRGAELYLWAFEGLDMKSLYEGMHYDTLGGNYY